MKILSITAGAAGMYCGSCFRDNALAAELLVRGHDVTLLPVYTPTRTDEPNVSARRVLFGGLSVYLQQRFSMFRHLPRAFDHLWDSPGVIRALASRSVETSPTVLGELTVAMLEGASGVLRREFDKLVEWTRGEPLPDVINLPNSLLIAMARPLRHVTRRPVCCTLQGEELFLHGLEQPYQDKALALIRAQVADVDRFIAVSEYCARYMSAYLRIPPDRISVVPLGIKMEGHTRREQRGDPFTIGYFARFAPEKGLHVLADAYIRLRRRTVSTPMRLEAAGYLSTAGHRYVADVRRTLEAAGLGGEFVCHGEVDRDGKLAFLNRLDVLSVPATYDEPKGMFLLEAMASGVPVVQPRRGAFTEIVEVTGGGLLVEPDAPDDLADGLYRLWSDPALAAHLGQQAYDNVRVHGSISRSANRLLSAYQAAIDAARGPIPIDARAPSSPAR
jgi:glycosyltransferase involved in cell wall biosynthesis